MKKITSLRFFNASRKLKSFVLFFLFFLPVVVVLAGFGRNLLPDTFVRVRASSQQADSGASLWQDVDEKSIPNLGNRPVIPLKYRTLRLNRGDLQQLLNGVPLEQPGAPPGTGVQIALPMPDGNFARFL